MNLARCFLTCVGLGSALALAACGGGNTSYVRGPGPSSTPNVQPIQVNTGPTGQAGDYPYTNGAFTSVTLCVPGTTTCQTIDGILVDTGSEGLRVLSSALTISLPPVTQGGNPAGECFPFVGAVTWGPVESADVKMAGEVGSGVPIQVIGNAGVFSTVPSSCTGMGTPEQDLIGLGANGILGIGPFAQDCGSACAQSSTNLDFYYSCPSSGCQVTTMNTGFQVENPIVRFATDNNGSVIELPAVSGSPPVATTVDGSLIFGIGTQSNNMLAGATVYPADPTTGNISTIFDNVQYTGASFLDSGSGAIIFADPTTTGMPVCGDNGLYCPASDQTFSATNVGVNGASGTFSFTVQNADTLFSLFPNDAAFADLAGPSTTTVGPSGNDFFDWGLPFYYGRSVFTAIEGEGSSGGPGPYYAY